MFESYFHIPRLKPWAMKCNDLYPMDLSIGIFSIKTVETILFEFQIYCPRFKPWAIKCNDLYPMDLSIGIFSNKTVETVLFENSYS